MTAMNRTLSCLAGNRWTTLALTIAIGMLRPARGSTEASSDIRLSQTGSPKRLTRSPDKDSDPPRAVEEPAALGIVNFKKNTMMGIITSPLFLRKRHTQRPYVSQDGTG